MWWLVFILFVALCFATYKAVIFQRACRDWGSQYRALDRGMEELGESMQADLLDEKEKRGALQISMDIAEADREILYRMATRCHESCLPTVHGFTDGELEVLAHMQNLYNPEPSEGA